MVKATIKVCIRIRPTQAFAKEKILIDSDHNNIQIQTIPSNDNNNNSSSSEKILPQLLNNKQNTFKFHFDDMFHNATQADVYDRRTRSTVRDVVVEGINGAILTYGQTGSGKTFTMVCYLIFCLFI